MIANSQVVSDKRSKGTVWGNWMQAGASMNMEVRLPITEWFLHKDICTIALQYFAKMSKWHDVLNGVEPTIGAFYSFPVKDSKVCVDKGGKYFVQFTFPGGLNDKQGVLCQKTAKSAVGLAIREIKGIKSPFLGVRRVTMQRELSELFGETPGEETVSGKLSTPLAVTVIDLEALFCAKVSAETFGETSLSIRRTDERLQLGPMVDGTMPVRPKERPSARMPLRQAVSILMIACGLECYRKFELKAA